jgi:hypothetical protein
LRARRGALHEEDHRMGVDGLSDVSVSAPVVSVRIGL